MLDSWISSDWRGITGNPGKLSVVVLGPHSTWPLTPRRLCSGLSFLAIGFDSIFVLQHFVFYRHSTLTLLNTVEPSSQEEDERRPLLGADEERAA